MEWVGRLLDAAIRTPWSLWLALAVASWLPILRIPALVAVGVPSDVQIGPIPLAFFAILFTSLAVPGALAPAGQTLWAAIGYIFDNLRLRWTIFRLSPDARAILRYVEDRAERVLVIQPDYPGVSELRDAGLMTASDVGRDKDWSRMHLVRDFGRRIERHRGVLRRSIPPNEALATAIHQSHMRAMRLVPRWGA